MSKPSCATLRKRYRAADRKADALAAQYDRKPTEGRFDRAQSAYWKMQWLARRLQRQGCLRGVRRS